MGGSHVRVREATVDDLPVLLTFGDELREQLLPAFDGGRGRSTALAARPAQEARYRDAIADADRHLVIAVQDGQQGGSEVPIGMALFTVASANALLDHPALHMSHAVVSPRHKRRGAGRAIVAAAAAYAEDRGVDQIVVSVHPGSRDANRFFARLGFAPLAVRRVAPLSVVRRRLAAHGASHAGAGSLNSDLQRDHVARRRPGRVGRLAGGIASLPLGRVDEPDPA